MFKMCLLACAVITGVVLTACETRPTPEPQQPVAVANLERTKPQPTNAAAVVPRRAANPPNPDIRKPMSPSYKIRDKNWNVIQRPSEIHALEIRASPEQDGDALLITVKNNGEAFDVERAGFIFMDSLLPQDPPVLWFAFEREMDLPRTIKPGEEIVVRISKADVLGLPADNFHANSRRGKDIVCAGVSMIDGDDDMHWYSVAGVSKFIKACTEKPESRFLGRRGGDAPLQR